MENIITFRTPAQKEYDKLCDRSKENLKAYDELLEKKQRKFDMAGRLFETDIEQLKTGKRSSKL